MSAHQHSKECKEIFALLSQYLDTELSPETCSEIEAHLKDCTPCIEFAESLKKTIALCRECSTTEEPPPLSKEALKELAAAYNKMLAVRRDPSR